MSNWKYDKVWCTSNKKFYTKDDLEELTFKEFDKIREFFVCKNNKDVEINCPARMIARTKSYGRPHNPEDHFEIHCFATHKKDTHSKDCPYDYVKTIGSSFIVVDKLTDRQKLKLMAILHKNIQENTNSDKGKQNAQKTANKPVIEQREEKTEQNGTIRKRWRTYIASKVLDIDEMNSHNNPRKEFIFKENNILIKIVEKHNDKDDTDVIFLNIYKNGKQIYWIAMGKNNYDSIIKNKLLDEIIALKDRWEGNISFVAWKDKWNGKVSFWVNSPETFVYKTKNK